MMPAERWKAFRSTTHESRKNGGQDVKNGNSSLYSKKKYFVKQGQESCWKKSFPIHPRENVSIKHRYEQGKWKNVPYIFIL